MLPGRLVVRRVRLGLAWGRSGVGLWTGKAREMGVLARSQPPRNPGDAMLSEVLPLLGVHIEGGKGGGIGGEEVVQALRWISGSDYVSLCEALNRMCHMKGDRDALGVWLVGSGVWDGLLERVQDGSRISIPLSRLCLRTGLVNASNVAILGAGLREEGGIGALGLWSRLVRTCASATGVLGVEEEERRLFASLSALRQAWGESFGRISNGEQSVSGREWASIAWGLRDAGLVRYGFEQGWWEEVGRSGVVTRGGEVDVGSGEAEGVVGVVEAMVVSGREDGRVMGVLREMLDENGGVEVMEKLIHGVKLPQLARLTAFVGDMEEADLHAVPRIVNSIQERIHQLALVEDGGVPWMQLVSSIPMPPPRHTTPFWELETWDVLLALSEQGFVSAPSFLLTSTLRKLGSIEKHLSTSSSSSHSPVLKAAISSLTSQISTYLSPSSSSPVNLPYSSLISLSSALFSLPSPPKHLVHHCINQLSSRTLLSSSSSSLSASDVREGLGVLDSLAEKVESGSVAKEEGKKGVNGIARALASFVDPSAAVRVLKHLSKLAIRDDSLLAILEQTILSASSPADISSAASAFLSLQPSLSPAMQRALSKVATTPSSPPFLVAHSTALLLLSSSTTPPTLPFSPAPKQPSPSSSLASLDPHTRAILSCSNLGWDVGVDGVLERAGRVESVVDKVAKGVPPDYALLRNHPIPNTPFVADLAFERASSSSLVVVEVDALPSHFLPKSSSAPPILDALSRWRERVLASSGVEVVRVAQFEFESDALGLGDEDREEEIRIIQRLLHSRVGTDVRKIEKVDDAVEASHGRKEESRKDHVFESIKKQVRGRKRGVVQSHKDVLKLARSRRASSPPPQPSSPSKTTTTTTTTTPTPSTIPSWGSDGVFSGSSRHEVVKEMVEADIDSMPRGPARDALKRSFEQRLAEPWMGPHAVPEGQIEFSKAMRKHTLPSTDSTQDEDGGGGGVGGGRAWKDMDSQDVAPSSSSWSSSSSSSSASSSSSTPTPTSTTTSIPVTSSTRHTPSSLATPSWLDESWKGGSGVREALASLGEEEKEVARAIRDARAMARRQRFNGIRNPKRLPAFLRKKLKGERRGEGHELVAERGEQDGGGWGVEEGEEAMRDMGEVEEEDRVVRMAEEMLRASQGWRSDEGFEDVKSREELKEVGSDDGVEGMEGIDGLGLGTNDGVDIDEALQAGDATKLTDAARVWLESGSVDDKSVRMALAALAAGSEDALSQALSALDKEGEGGSGDGAGGMAKRVAEARRRAEGAAAVWSAGLEEGGSGDIGGDEGVVEESEWSGGGLDEKTVEELLVAMAAKEGEGGDDADIAARLAKQVVEMEQDDPLTDALTDGDDSATAQMIAKALGGIESEDDARKLLERAADETSPEEVEQLLAQALSSSPQSPSSTHKNGARTMKFDDDDDDLSSVIRDLESTAEALEKSSGGTKED